MSAPEPAVSVPVEKVVEAVAVDKGDEGAAAVVVS